MTQSRGNQGSVLLAMGRHDEALTMFKECTDAFREIGEPLGEAKSLSNQAEVFADLEHWQKAIDFSQEALAIAIRHGYGDLADQITEEIDLYKSHS